MKLKAAILTAGLVTVFSTPAYANEPDLIVWPLLLLLYPALGFLTFLIPLGLLRKIMALFTFIILSLILGTADFRFYDIKTEAFLFITAMGSWLLAIFIAFICKKFHFLDGAD